MTLFVVLIPLIGTNEARNSGATTAITEPRAGQVNGASVSSNGSGDPSHQESLKGSKEKGSKENGDTSNPDDEHSTPSHPRGGRAGGNRGGRGGRGRGGN